MAGFDAYGGNPSMYKVHKFMNLGKAEMTYFITQVGMAAASFGVAKDDIDIVAKALSDTFDMRCSAPAEVIKGKGPQPQAICIKSDCQEAKDAKCDAYDATAMAPAMCSMTSGSMTPTGTGSTTGAATATSTGSKTGSTTGSATGSATSKPTTGAGNVNNLGVAALVAAAAFAL